METSTFASVKALEAQVADLRRVKTKLLEFPALASDAERTLDSAKDALKDWQGKLAGVSGELMLQVTNEVEGGKEVGAFETLVKTSPKYPNEQSRKVAHARLLREDPEAVALAEQVAQAQAGARAAEVTVARIENDRRSWESYQHIAMKEADVMLGLVDLSFANLGIEKLSRRMDG